MNRFTDPDSPIRQRIHAIEAREAAHRDSFRMPATHESHPMPLWLKAVYVIGICACFGVMAQGEPAPSKPLYPADRWVSELVQVHTAAVGGTGVCQ